MVRTLTHTLRQLGRDREGATAVEFGLVFPVALLLLIGTMEFAYSLFISATVENAVLSASRYGVIGNTEEGVAREDAILAIVEENSFGNIDADEIELTTLVYSTFDNIGEEEPYVDDNDSGTYDAGEDYSDVNGNGQWDEDVGVAGVGGAGDIVLYRLTYSTSSLTRFLDPILESISYTAVVAVRNEPF